MSASARTWLGPVSPRRIARRAIGKKAGFPIGFIRLTSVDSVAPTMARTNGARVVCCAACSWNERIPLRVESVAGNCRWQRYELDRREREKIQFAFVRIWLNLIPQVVFFDLKYMIFQVIYLFLKHFAHPIIHNIITNINYDLNNFWKFNWNKKRKYEWNNNIYDALTCAETINGWYQDSFDMLTAHSDVSFSRIEIVTNI